MNERKKILYPGVEFWKAETLNDMYIRCHYNDLEGLHKSLMRYTIDDEDFVVYQTKTQRVFRKVADRDKRGIE